MNLLIFRKDLQDQCNWRQMLTLWLLQFKCHLLWLDQQVLKYKELILLFHINKKWIFSFKVLFHSIFLNEVNDMLVLTFQINPQLTKFKTTTLKKVTERFLFAALGYLTTTHRFAFTDLSLIHFCFHFAIAF